MSTTTKTETETNHAKDNAQAWLDNIKEMFAGFKALDDREADEVTIDGDTYTDADEVRDRVQESVLSVEVRKDWHTLDDTDIKPDEFRILLTTGGPACQIVGDLNDYCEPVSPKVQYQDWGTPWTDMDTDSDEDEALKWFCGCFYFGE